MRRYRSAALAATALMAGCSFFVQGPPDDYDVQRHGAPACNSSGGGRVALDVVGAVWGIALTAIAVAEWRAGSDVAPGYAVVGAVGTAIHVTAIPVGLTRTARCRRAREEFISWAGLRGQRSPDVYTPARPPPPAPPPPPPSCPALRRALAAETNAPRRFELLRQIRSQCGTAPPGATSPPS